MRFLASGAPQPARALLACLVFLGACSVTSPTSPDAPPAATQLPAPGGPSSPPNYSVPTPPSAPSTATSIGAAIVRLDAGTAETVVSTGVPLQPGVLRPGQESFVHVTVGGVEKPAYVAGLKSLHADGSLRAVLVQLRATVSKAQPLAARVEISTTARSAANTLTAQGPNASVPAAVILPTSADYLVATDLVGPTLTAAATTALGAEYARYDADFSTAADVLWASEGAKWEGNYYDRALVYFAMWVRTANPEYWRRGAMIASQYRHDYLESNNYGASPHWAQMEGLEKHYLLTGDEASRTAVVRVADVFTQFLPEYYTSAGGDLRIMARFIHGSLLAWRLTPNGDTPAGTTPRDWAARIDFLLGKAAAWQLADGSYPAAVVCNGQMNYQAAMLDDALIRVHTQYRADPALVAQVRRSADQLWNTQWVASAGAFQYLALSCPGVGGLETAGDLNGLFASTYAWLYRKTGDAKYRDAGEQVFVNTVRGWYLPGTKQFNQAFTYSFRHLAYR